MLGSLVSGSVGILVDDAAEEAFAADVDAVGGRGDGRLTAVGSGGCCLSAWCCRCSL
jgi:hypothetical protein